MPKICSPFGKNKILSSSPIHNKIIINPDDLPISDDILPVQCEIIDLPFLPESIDAVVMLHILEFTKNPKVILREVYDALIPGGYVIILGFNPHSLWGITKFFKRIKTDIWHGNWLNSRRLRRWLFDMGFDLENHQTFYFHPPCENAKKIAIIEEIGQIFWPCCGASYMMLAKKTSMVVTPISNTNESFVKSNEVIKGLAKPTSRTRAT